MVWELMTMGFWALHLDEERRRGERAEAGQEQMEQVRISGLGCRRGGVEASACSRSQMNRGRLRPTRQG